MQQITVPQFIYVEDTILGPLTVRQFLIMIVDFILTIICYKLFDFSLFLTSSIVLFAIFGGFAFVKVNGQNFHLFFLNLLKTLSKPRLRVWLNIDKEEMFGVEEDSIDFSPVEVKSGIGSTRLSELAISVDTGGKYKINYEQTAG